MGRHSDYSIVREQRREKHGGGCCLPAFIIAGSFLAIAGATGMFLKIVGLV